MTWFTDQNLVANDLPHGFPGGTNNEGHGMTNALLPMFQPAPMLFEYGEGAWLIAANGERYLDFGAGIAVNALGYSHPHLVGALERQSRKLWHLSNVYRIPETERLAERLTAACFADVAFFASSGAEANECAIKVARRHHDAHELVNRMAPVETVLHDQDGLTRCNDIARDTGRRAIALRDPRRRCDTMDHRRRCDVPFFAARRDPRPRRPAQT